MVTAEASHIDREYTGRLSQVLRDGTVGLLKREVPFGVTITALLADVSRVLRYVWPVASVSRQRGAAFS